LLIFGATGTLGQAFARICELRGLAYRLLSRADADLTDREAVGTVMEQLRPWAAVNCTGYVRVDDAEHDRERCFRENSSAAETLAVACSGAKARLVTFSSDLVFDGEKAAAYLESDSVNPLNVYGASKAQAEVKVLSALADALVVRTSSFFGPWDEYNFVTRTLADLRNGVPVEALEDVWTSPTYVPDLVHAALDLLIDAESGIWHLANEGGTTWADLARKAADAGSHDRGLVRGCVMADLHLAAARPSRSILTSERGILLGPWEGALDRYMDDRERFTHTTASAVCASMA
jgi:dTDP-4-dehydrorhamnose reductase